MIGNEVMILKGRTLGGGMRSRGGRETEKISGRGVIHHHMSEMISRDQYIHNKRYYIFNLSGRSKKVRKSKFPRPLQGKTGLLYIFFPSSFPD